MAKKKSPAKPAKKHKAEKAPPDLHDEEAPPQAHPVPDEPTPAAAPPADDLFKDDDPAPVKEPKRFPLPLPCRADAPFPDEIVFAPKPVEPEHVTPLAEPHGPVPCIATSFPAFLGLGPNYIVLTAEDGQALPEVPDTGMRVLVQFLPPVQS